jgi:hypothetical protein
MADDTLIDDLVEGVQLTASSPTTPQPTVTAKMTKIKVQRAQTKLKFLEHFKKVPKIIKSINDIKFQNVKSTDETNKKRAYMSKKKQDFSTRVSASTSAATEQKQLDAQTERTLKQNQIYLPVDVNPETPSPTPETDTPHLR